MTDKIMEQVKQNKPGFLLYFHTHDYYYARILNKKMGSLGYELIHMESRYGSKPTADIPKQLIVLVSHNLLSCPDSLTNLFQLLLEENWMLKTVLVRIPVSRKSRHTELFPIEQESSDFPSDLTGNNTLLLPHTAENLVAANDNSFLSPYLNHYNNQLSRLLESGKTDLKKNLSLYQLFYQNLDQLRQSLFHLPVLELQDLQLNGFSPLLELFNRS